MPSSHDFLGHNLVVSNYFGVLEPLFLVTKSDMRQIFSDMKLGFSDMKLVLSDIKSGFSDMLIFHDISTQDNTHRFSRVY